MRDDIIERSLGHFHKADATFGERLTAAVRTARTRR
jgi:hypothetical protein